MEKVKQYGKVGIITHLTLSWTFFAGLYGFVSWTKQPERLIRFMKLQDKIPKGMGAFAIAGIIYKALMPVRIGVSVLAVPIVVKVFDIDIPELPADPV